MTALGFRFSRVVAADLSPCFRLRHEVFCGEAGILAKSRCRDGVEFDHYDDHAIHIGAYDRGGELVGTFRIVTPSQGMALPMLVHCPPSDVKLPQGFGLGEIAEVSRMAISRERVRRALGANRAWLPKSAARTRTEHRRGTAASRRVLIEQTSQVFAGLLDVGYRESKREGVKCWVAAMEPAMHRRLKRAEFHFEKAGPSFDYHGVVHPYVLSVESFESTAQRSIPSIFSEYKRLRDRPFHAKQPIDIG